MKYVLIFPDLKLISGSNKKIYSKFRVLYISLSLCSISYSIRCVAIGKKVIIIDHLILMKSQAEKSLPQV